MEEEEEKEEDGLVEFDGQQRLDCGSGCGAFRRHRSNLVLSDVMARTENKQHALSLLLDELGPYKHHHEARVFHVWII